MSRSLKYDIPGVDWRVPLEALRDPAALFGRPPGAPLRLVVDLGFGRGEFLLALAEKEPDGAFLGVEVSFKRVLKLTRRLARTPLANVRLVETTAQRALAALPAASVRVFWINFPDPWPKKRHRARRLLQPDFVAELARVLAPGGELHVATDDADYAEAIDAVLRAEARLGNRFAPERFRRDVEGRPPTSFELEWRALGRELHFFTYQRIRDPVAS